MTDLVYVFGLAATWLDTGERVDFDHHGFPERRQRAREKLCGEIEKGRTYECDTDLVKLGKTSAVIPSYSSFGPTAGDSVRLTDKLVAPRRRSLETAGRPLEVERVWVPCGKRASSRRAGFDAEDWLKKFLDPFRVMGEWFRFPHEALGCYASEFIEQAVRKYEEETGVCMIGVSAYAQWRDDRESRVPLYSMVPTRYKYPSVKEARNTYVEDRGY